MPESIGGIVLCGGQSRRMGQSKAWLPFGETTMLQRVVTTLRDVVGPIVVVAAPDQTLPDLPDDVAVVRDDAERQGPLRGLFKNSGGHTESDGLPERASEQTPQGTLGGLFKNSGGHTGSDGLPERASEQTPQGPLAGIAKGLQALAPQVAAAYVSSCDVPLLRPAFVRAVIDRLLDFELAIPREDRYYHPLAAVYRTELADRCRTLLDAGQRRPLHLVEASRSHVFNVACLREVDPHLDSLRNANTPEEYRQLLICGGLRNPDPETTADGP